MDPEGKLFFSIGFCCTNWQGMTITEQRENWFENLPGLQAQFKECEGTGWCANGHFGGRNARHFDFSQANIMRKHGANWEEDYKGLVHRRLRSWGMNTIANWSDQRIALQKKTPYTWPIWLWNQKKMPNGFYDVFDAGFKTSIMEQTALVAKPSLGDPWCIGYYVENELPLGDNDYSLAVTALTSPPDQPAKAAFIEDLKAKYEAIEKLNAAWGTSHASWDALRERVSSAGCRAASSRLACSRRAGRPAPPLRCRFTSTTRRSPISRSATRRRWHGCCLVSSLPPRS